MDAVFKYNHYRPCNRRQCRICCDVNYYRMHTPCSVDIGVQRIIADYSNGNFNDEHIAMSVEQRNGCLEMRHQHLEVRKMINLMQIISLVMILFD